MPTVCALPVGDGTLGAQCGATVTMRQSRMAPNRLRRLGLLALRELFVGHTECCPARRLRDDPFEGSQLDVGDALRRRADGRASLAQLARRVDHDAAELHDGDVTRAESLMRTV